MAVDPSPATVHVSGISQSDWEWWKKYYHAQRYTAFDSRTIVEHLNHNSQKKCHYYGSAINLQCGDARQRVL